MAMHIVMTSRARMPASKPAQQAASAAPKTIDLELPACLKREPGKPPVAAKPGEAKPAAPAASAKVPAGMTAEKAAKELAKTVKAAQKPATIPAMKNLGKAEQTKREEAINAEARKGLAQADQESAAAEQQKKVEMKKSARTAIDNATLRKIRTAPAKAKPAEGKSKTDIARAMLSRKNGATRKEIAEATDWPSINLKPIVERMGKKLIEKDGRYFIG